MYDSIRNTTEINRPRMLRIQLIHSLNFGFMFQKRAYA